MASEGLIRLEKEEAEAAACLIRNELQRLQERLHQQLAGDDPGDHSWTDTADEVAALWGLYRKVQGVSK